ncbi:C-type lectin domain family 2 member A-like [Rhinoderma darwinii]|uniref:C-type lectin domain family 2 member A-like n=1 Tax=Rhinoderma darwinii TaxID=43563 RepID=UPI003F67BDFD
MENITPSPAESGFLTTGDPQSCRQTPSGTLESLYSEEHELQNTWDNPRKPFRSRLHSSSVNDLDEEPNVYSPQPFHYPSSPNIPESYLNRILQENCKINEAQTERDPPQESQPFINISGETGVNEENKKKTQSLCQKLVKKWWIVSHVILCIVIAVLLGFLFSRGAVKDVPSCEPPCNESWMLFEGHCYYFSNVAKTWNDSRDFCTEHDSTLAVLTDPKIEKNIGRYRENVNYWIGLYMNNNGLWMWINGSLYNGSVDNHNSNQLRCAFLNSHLGALDCSTSRQWICVKKST